MARARKAKKKKEPRKVDWERMPEADKLVTELVAKHHRHLERAKIICLGKPKAGKKRGRPVEATARKATKAMTLLMKEGVGTELHYYIEIGLDLWALMNAKDRKILIDHELCHFGGQDLEKGTWDLVGHDVEEFTAIVKRHGAYRSDLVTFGEQLKLALDKA